MRADYKQPIAGGEWDHRGDDCATHGDNVPFAKLHKSSEPYLCVACMLTAACVLAENALLASLPNARPSAPATAQNGYTESERAALEQAL